MAPGVAGVSDEVGASVDCATCGGSLSGVLVCCSLVVEVGRSKGSCWMYEGVSAGRGLVGASASATVGSGTTDGLRTGVVKPAAVVAARSSGHMLAWASEATCSSSFRQMSMSCSWDNEDKYCLLRATTPKG